MSPIFSDDTEIRWDGDDPFGHNRAKRRRLADGRKEGVGMGNRPKFPMPLAKIRISEGHDTASHFALNEVIISLVNLGERVFPGEKFVEL
jgi:hypothetical protein